MNDRIDMTQKERTLNRELTRAEMLLTDLQNRVSITRDLVQIYRKGIQQELFANAGIAKGQRVCMTLSFWNHYATITGYNLVGMDIGCPVYVESMDRNKDGTLEFRVMTHPSVEKSRSSVGGISWDEMQAMVDCEQERRDELPS